MSRVAWSPGDCVAHLKISYFAWARLVRKLGLEPVTRAGNARLFTDAAVRRMEEALKQKESN